MVIQMDNKNIPLQQLPLNTKAKVSAISGGHGFQNKLTTMGIRPGRDIKVISRQPFRGPITIEICGCQMTMGRGMAQKILVDF